MLQPESEWSDNLYYIVSIKLTRCRIIVGPTSKPTFDCGSSETIIYFFVMYFARSVIIANLWELHGGSLKGERQKPPNTHQHIVNFIFPRRIDGSD